MKKTITALFLTGALSLLFVSCKKEAAAPAKDEVPESVLAQIKALGFSTQGVQKVEEGYLVEKDIILTPENLSEHPATPNLVIAQEEHYRTFNLVSTTKYATITVSLSNSSSQHQAVLSAALDEAIARYNAENMLIHFQRVTGRANITVNTYYQISNVLGSSGFPSSNGSPYKTVKMNTFWYSSSTSATNINYIGTIMAHEIGHCIGFRHTDYMNRSYSCGGSGGDEGSGVYGAVFIPGTPSGPDANSWMLACIGENENRPFTNNDHIALTTVY